MVVKLDRLGRSTRDVLNLAHELGQRGAAVRVLEPAIDTGGPMGKMVLTVLGMVAEMELSFIKDRQRAGIEAAKARGVYKGRPVTFDHAKIVALRKDGLGATEIARAVGCKRGNVYKALKAGGLHRLALHRERIHTLLALTALDTRSATLKIAWDDERRLRKSQEAAGESHSCTRRRQRCDRTSNRDRRAVRTGGAADAHGRDHGAGERGQLPIAVSIKRTRKLAAGLGATPKSMLVCLSETA